MSRRFHAKALRKGSEEIKEIRFAPLRETFANFAMKRLCVNLMNKEEIIRVYKRRFKELSGHYNSLLEDFDKDEIHDFRLEIKRLRAFIRLVNHARPGHESRIHGPLKAFYNATGDLRNIQLHRERIIGLSKDLPAGAPQQYLQLLDEEETKFRNRTREIAAHLSLRKPENSLIQNCPEEINPQTVQAFIFQKKTELEALVILFHYSDENLHEIRKILKDLIYNWKYIDEMAAAILPPLWVKEKLIDHIAAVFGNFLDLCVSLFFLTPPFITTADLAADQSILDEWRSYLEKQKETLKKEIGHILAPVREELLNESIEGQIIKNL